MRMANLLRRSRLKKFRPRGRPQHRSRRGARPHAALTGFSKRGARLTLQQGWPMFGGTSCDRQSNFATPPVDGGGLDSPGGGWQQQGWQDKGQHYNYRGNRARAPSRTAAQAALQQSTGANPPRAVGPQRRAEALRQIEAGLVASAQTLGHGGGNAGAFAAHSMPRAPTGPPRRVSEATSAGGHPIDTGNDVLAALLKRMQAMSSTPSTTSAPAIFRQHPRRRRRPPPRHCGKAWWCPPTLHKI